MSEYYGMVRKKRAALDNQLTMRALSDPRFFFYSGPPQGFQNRIQDTMNLPAIFTEAHISITGDKVKEMDTCCFVMTIILGSCICPLLFIMCCDWWKQIVHAVYEIPTKTYQLLQFITQRPQLTSLTLLIADNNFDIQKAKIIYDLLSKSNIKNFKFYNGAANMDHKAAQFSTFEFNMKPIKMLPIKSDMQWYNQSVQ